MLLTYVIHLCYDFGSENSLAPTWPRKRGEGTEAPRQERRATSLRMAQGCWTLAAEESPRSRSPHWPEQDAAQGRNSAEEAEQAADASGFRKKRRREAAMCLHIMI